MAKRRLRLGIAIVLFSLAAPPAEAFFLRPGHGGGKFGPGRPRLLELLRNHFNRARSAGKSLGEMSNPEVSKSSQESRDWVNALNEMIAESGNEIRVMFEEGEIDRETYEDVLSQLANEEEEAFAATNSMRGTLGALPDPQAPQAVEAEPTTQGQGPANQTVYEDYDSASLPSWPTSEITATVKESAPITVAALPSQPVASPPSAPASPLTLPRSSLVSVEGVAPERSSMPPASKSGGSAQAASSANTTGHTSSIFGGSSGSVASSAGGSLDRDASRFRAVSALHEVQATPSAKSKPVSKPVTGPGSFKSVLAKISTTIDGLSKSLARGTRRATTDLGNWLREATGQAPSRSLLLPGSSQAYEAQDDAGLWWGISALVSLFAGFASVLLWMYRKWKIEQARNEHLTLVAGRLQDFQVRIRTIDGRPRAVVEIADLATREIVDTKRLVDGSVFLARNLSPELARSARVQSGLDRVRYSRDGRFEKTDAEPKMIVYRHKEVA